MPGVERTFSATLRLSLASMDACFSLKWVTVSLATHAILHLLHTINGYLSNFTNGSIAVVSVLAMVGRRHFRVVLWIGLDKRSE
jgi:hypothetical protein